jgi:hypothetical protein
MARSNTKNKLSNVGRPTLYSEEIVSKIESIFKIGGTVEQALSYAGITKPTYYDWIEKHPNFLTRMESARTYADIVAKNIVVDSMIKDKDVNTAKWWLEKREFKQIQQNNTQVNIQAPKPILGDLIDLRIENVSTDNNAQENNTTQQEN